MFAELTPRYIYKKEVLILTFAIAIIQMESRMTLRSKKKMYDSIV